MKLKKKSVNVLRVENEMSVKKLSEESGLSTSTISAGLNGKNLAADTVGKIARALGCDVSEIIRND